MYSMKNIVISGGSDGLGKALAKALSAGGHKVAILAPNPDKLKAAAKEANCAYKLCDISDWAQVEAAVGSLADELGRIDVLINSAGVGYSGKIEDADPDHIQHIFDVNVVGTLFLTKAVVAHMRPQGGGYIINVNSTGGISTKPERALYNGSKWALTGITKVLQAELAPFNIKVTGLYPGAMEQTMSKRGVRRPQANSIAYQEMIDAVEFVLSRNPNTVVPELGLKNLDS
jgi:NAD(P)-dependent dehydrogenase (short-subunit alcohol dehydrogenase family)